MPRKEIVIEEVGNHYPGGKIVFESEDEVSANLLMDEYLQASALLHEQKKEDLRKPLKNVCVEYGLRLDNEKIDELLVLMGLLEWKEYYDEDEETTEQYLDITDAGLEYLYSQTYA